MPLSGPMANGRNDRRPGQAASRLEFAAFSVKNRPMIAVGQALLMGSARRTAAGALALAAMIAMSLACAQPAAAQFFSDRPAPVPPAAVPQAPGGAISLAPPSGAGAAPSLPTQGLPGPLVQPPVTSATPPVPAPLTTQGVLALTAKFGKDLPVITNGLIWRVYSDRPDPATGQFRLIREERSPTPNIVLPPGNYVVHAALGLVSAVRTVTLKQDTIRESFELPAGGLRIEGRVGTTKIPQGQITFNIFKGSQFEVGERAPVASNIPASDVVLLPEGTYYIISNYGDANSVVRSDIRVAASKLTDVIVTHRAAVITLKLVSDRGGEALANTAWSVITPGGDVIKESTGAFPRVVLSEGEYRAIARNEGKTFERGFNVVNGVDGEVVVTAR